MGIAGAAPAVVYISPQFLNPLVASTTPITMAIAQRPEIAQPAAEKQAETQTKQAVDHATSPTTLNPDLAGVAASGRVDVYA